MNPTLSTAADAHAWDAFLTSQRFAPFLQSWTMGEVYTSIGQEPVRLIATEGSHVVGIAFGHVVRARRGTHLSVPYGPVAATDEAARVLVSGLLDAAQSADCAFVRMSPFRPLTSPLPLPPNIKSLPSPLHLLAEHLWYLPLHHPDPWQSPSPTSGIETGKRTEEEVFKNLRSTQRNLIRRAQKEGVTVTASTDPIADLPHFLALHDETRKRHGFTAYTNAFFRAQTELFAKKNQATLYLAHYQGEVIASSIHMHFGSETSYHHGASTHRFSKIPASYLLQWTAICDALKRGDRVYNFWGIAPSAKTEAPHPKPQMPKHPFAGVTLFKTGFGGSQLALQHCIDIPLSPLYYPTRWFEFVRKWKRGF